ncbi:hypothetical protein Dda_4924 [Drechslerella dactyloides]|uniref:Ribosomal protein S16 n=1 Tax=Drechslerella dactyloides TaxID=74499 RepID=A0AAD6NJT6_DREDA|nr:hypothetical protein Dda_4924 [Drechslerella dactyloides]
MRMHELPTDQEDGRPPADEDGPEDGGIVVRVVAGPLKPLPSNSARQLHSLELRRQPSIPNTVQGYGRKILGNTSIATAPMVVRLRLARFGKRNSPIYNIVVSQGRTARNSKPMEVIGTYDPIPKAQLPSESTGDSTNRKPIKEIQLDVARAKYWLGVGAQPSDPVWRLLAMFGLIERQWKVVRIPAQQEDKAVYEKIKKIKILPDKTTPKAAGSS